MTPPKSIEAKIDETIDNDIYYQEHERYAEAEQLDLIIETE